MKITPLLRSNNLQGRPRAGCDAATKEEHLGLLCALQVQDQGGDDDCDYEDEDGGGGGEDDGGRSVEDDAIDGGDGDEDDGGGDCLP